jgi:hypothetical protein
MEGISVDGRNGNLIQSVAEMIVRFHGDVFPKLAKQFKGVRTHKRASRPFLSNSKGSGLINALHDRS